MNLVGWIPLQRHNVAIPIINFDYDELIHNNLNNYYAIKYSSLTDEVKNLIRNSLKFPTLSTIDISNNPSITFQSAGGIFLNSENRKEIENIFSFDYIVDNDNDIMCGIGNWLYDGDDYRLPGLTRHKKVDGGTGIGSMSTSEGEYSTYGYIGITVDNVEQIRATFVSPDSGYLIPNSPLIFGFGSSNLTIYATENEALKHSGFAGSSPYNPGGTSITGGGGGSFGQGEASVDITGNIPSGSTEANTGKTGLFGSYLISPTLLKTVLGDRLWGVDAANFIGNAGLNILFGRPIDSVIDVVSYPFDMSILGNFSIPTYTGNMKLGAETLLANYSKCLSSPYATFDWGTIQLSQFWGNFLDYAPYTKIELYLPWGTGFVEIDPNQVTPGTLSVITNFDLAKGTCLHIVKSTQVLDGISQPSIVVGTFEGQPGKHIPVTGADYSSRTIWALTAATIAAAGTSWTAFSGVGKMSGGSSPTEAIRALPTPTIGAGSSPLSIGTGNLPIPYNPNAIDFASTGGSLPSIGGGGKDVPLFASTISFDSNVLASMPAMDMTPPKISRNGSLSSNTSSMGIQHPYLVITRPIQNVPENYGHHFGYPSNILTNLSMLTGYTEVGAIHYENIDALAPELSELDRLLKGGVIFQWLS